MSLAPCPSCSRHVRGSDASCPFCAEPAPLVPASAVDAAPAVGTRAQIFLGALTVAAVAASVAACSPTPQAIAPVYGAPVPVEERDAGAVPLAADAAPPVLPVAPSGAYGAPPSP
ncbi:MAG: hypothetical protein IPF92_12495 [Myxococcales bacterium]|nr:hypothetical protein [Myxococcales bacterium]